MTWGTCDHEDHVCQHVVGPCCVNFHAECVTTDSALTQPPTV